MNIQEQANDQLAAFEKAINSAKDLMRVQGASGNWDCDPYMHGMYNGMELILSMFENRQPDFRDAPSKWGCENPKTEKAIAETEGPEAIESAE